MYYEINVSLHGVHYFATAKRSLTNETVAEAAYNHFKRLFPESEGYKVRCTQYETVGRAVSF